jgi:Tfp pilus assembly protein PilN
MIRINLLGGERAKKSAPAVPLAGEEGGGNTRVALICLVVLLLAVAGNAFYFYRLTRAAVQLQVDLAAVNAEYLRLAQVKTRYDDLTRQRDAYKKRVDVIDELRARQAGPVSLLSAVGDTVQQTHQVWLSSMNDEGNAVTLKGRALSIHAVADLMQNLQATGYFRSIEIKSSYQDEKLRDVQAFLFELTCEKKTEAAAPAAPPVRKS